MPAVGLQRGMDLWSDDAFFLSNYFDPLLSKAIFDYSQLTTALKQFIAKGKMLQNILNASGISV